MGLNHAGWAMVSLYGAALFADPPGAQLRVTVNVPAALATGNWSSPKAVTLPPGFQLSVWAQLDGARFMAVAPNGDIFVSQPSGGSVYVFRPSSTDLPKKFKYIEGLSGPHGLAFDTVEGNTYLYIAETTQISRFTYNTGDTSAHDRQVIVKGLPDGSLPGFNGNYAHPLKNIAVAPDHRIYVGIGSSCNVCESDAAASPVRGAVYVYNPDGSGGRLFARGLRNAEGLAFFPGTNTLWAAVNNRDQLPYPYKDSSNQFGQIVTSYVDDHPPEPFTQVRDGGNYGWPFCNPTQDGPSGFYRMKFDLDLDTNSDGRIDCSTMDVIDHGFQAHSAPLQMTFTQNTAFPAAYREGAIVAFHGSWNRSVPTGYKVVYLPWDYSKPGPGTEVDLIDGLREIGSRPAGVAITPTGSLLISDDYSGTIFELTYAAPIVSGADGYAMIAPDSYASVYGANLSSQTQTAAPPYPTTLGSAALQLTDAAGTTFQPTLSYVSPGQINFVVPIGVATGTAKIVLGAPGSMRNMGTVQVSQTAAALFSLDGSGKGTAAAVAVDGAGNAVPVFSCQGSSCSAIPIDVRGAAKYLSLYGTGVRAAAAESVRILMNGVAYSPTFSGAQPTYPGLDQINIQLPASLAGSGSVTLQVSIGGVLSNAVTLAIR